jgi:rubrerythrin
MTDKIAIEFDLDRYLRASKKLDLSHLDWDRIPDHPLSDGDVMCMHYMMDIETHTVIYLRDLLGTRAASDPQITAFLSCWVYEELWHGEAFSDFLRAYGIEVPAEPKLPDGSTPMPTRARRTQRVREELGIGHQLSLVPMMLGSMLLPDFIALHMTWGAINELTTLTGYHALIRRSDHPVLNEMLKRVIQDERRHFAFYRAQGKARLTRAPRRTRRVVRWVFENFWTPVGAGVKSQEEVDALTLYLFGYDDEGREMLREIDRTVSDIPGLEGLTLVEDYLDAALERERRSPGWAGVVEAPGPDPALRGSGSEAWDVSRSDAPEERSPARTR